MIDLYYWPTPNGWKVSILLEEFCVPYRIVPVNIDRGEQFKREFLALSPNNRMPAIVDHAPEDGGPPAAVFESGAILVYLAEKAGRFMPSDLRGRYEVLQWVMWQMGGLGPMSGQAVYFRSYADAPIHAAIERYTKEVNRLYGVMDLRLRDREYLGGEYSIADMASFAWVVPHERVGQRLSDFPSLKRWFDAIHARPAVRRGLAVGAALRKSAPLDGEAKKVLFGQTARKE